jgi:hypothetical protein
MIKRNIWFLLNVNIKLIYIDIVYSLAIRELTIKKFIVILINYN